MSRKTIDVNTLLDESNRILATNIVSKDYRRGIISMVEFMLYKSDRYNGFVYLIKEDVPRGQEPGIIPKTGTMVEAEIHDETRRRYLSGKTH